MKKEKINNNEHKITIKKRRQSEKENASVSKKRERT